MPDTDIPNSKGQNKKRLFTGLFKLRYVILLIIFIGAYWFLQMIPSAEVTSWQTFKKEMLLDHDVDKVRVVNKEKVEVYIKKESLKKPKYIKIQQKAFGGSNTGPHYFFTIGSVDIFEKNLEEAQTEFQDKDKLTVQYYTESNSIGQTLLSWILPFSILALLWYYIMRRSVTGSTGSGKSIFDFGRSNPDIYEKGKNNPITFKDVAGYDEAKTELMEIVEFLKQPDNFTKLGAKIPKGVLLVGAPGTGKTLMVKAVAGEAGVPFFSLSGSEFIEMFVGVGASRVRDLFNKAKQKAPSIIFIDEIDTIGKVRGKALSLQANDERDSTLNQLLAEMDGFGPNTGVIVLAATNRADILDPALLRAGRFDRHIHFDLPNIRERIAIFNVHLKPLITDVSVDAEQLAALTPGFSGADIANVCNEAALIAVRKKKQKVDPVDFSDSIDRIVTGLEKKSKVISPEEKKVIAYHEAGHALTSWMLKNVDPLLKVSIIPRGKSLGGAWYLPEERQIVTRSQFFDRLCAALGGRVAEEIVFQEISSGALDDLEKATKQAYMMVAQLGLSEKLGNISYYDSTGVYENSFHKPYSEATAQLIDEEVRDLINHAVEVSKIIILNNRDKLDALAQLLQKKEVVYKKDMEPIFGVKAKKESK